MKAKQIADGVTSGERKRIAKASRRYFEEVQPLIGHDSIETLIRDAYTVGYFDGAIDENQRAYIRRACRRAKDAS